MSSHGTAEGVSLHHSLSESLCEACRVYLMRLQREAFSIAPLDDLIDVTVKIPRAAFYLLADRAADAGLTLPEFIAGMAVDSVGTVGRGITFSQEKQIRALWLASKSTAEIARTVGVTVETVRRRINRWGGESNGRPKKTNHQKETR